MAYCDCKTILESNSCLSKKDIQQILYRICETVDSLPDFPHLFSLTVKYYMFLNDLLNKKWKKYADSELQKCSNFDECMYVCKNSPYDNKLLKKIYSKAIQTIDTFRDACVLMRCCILYKRFNFIILNKMLEIASTGSEIKFVIAMSANYGCISKKVKSRLEGLKSDNIQKDSSDYANLFYDFK